MGLQNIGWSGLVLILVALLLVFGPKKLPDIGKAFGSSLREFRKATQGMTEEMKNAVREDVSQASTSSAMDGEQSNPAAGAQSAPTAAASASTPLVQPIELKTSSGEQAEVHQG